MLLVTQRTRQRVTPPRIRGRCAALASCVQSASYRPPWPEPPSVTHLPPSRPLTCIACDPRHNRVWSETCVHIYLHDAIDAVRQGLSARPLEACGTATLQPDARHGHANEPLGEPLCCPALICMLTQHTSRFSPYMQDRWLAHPPHSLRAKHWHSEKLSTLGALKETRMHRA